MQLDRDKAAGIFIDSLIAHAYQGAVHTIVELLNNVPRGLKNSERWVNLHRWYAQLSQQDQSNVRAIIEEATSSAVFNTLNIFDGTAGTLIRGKYVDLLIRMLVYADSNSWRDESPEIIVDLNPSTSTDSDWASAEKTDTRIRYRCPNDSQDLPSRVQRTGCATELQQQQTRVRDSRGPGPASQPAVPLAT